MNAGKELDAEVAVRVMGGVWKVTPFGNCRYLTFDPSLSDNPVATGAEPICVDGFRLPRYSRNMKDAATILESAYWYSLERHPDSRRHECMIVLKEGGEAGYVACESMAEAICEAALLAAGKDAAVAKEQHP